MKWKHEIDISGLTGEAKKYTSPDTVPQELIDKFCDVIIEGLERIAPNLDGNKLFGKEDVEQEALGIASAFKELKLDPERSGYSANALLIELYDFADDNTIWVRTYPDDDPDSAYIELDALKE
jgi:hypothetical protein